MTQYVLKHKSPFLEVGEVVSETEKSYMVKQHMVKADGSLMHFGERKRWPKDDVMVIQGEDLRVVRALVEERHHIEDITNALRKTYAFKRDEVLAHIRDPSKPHDHIWRDGDRGTVCRYCGEMAVTEEEAAQGLQQLFG